MLTKIIYVIVDCIAIATMLFTIRAFKSIKERYGHVFIKAMRAGILAIIANIIVAISFNSLMAEHGYCAYFVCLDWTIFYLSGFLLSYTGHDQIIKKFRYLAGTIMGIDSLLLLLNPMLDHEFYIFETRGGDGTVFFQTGFLTLYYIHLTVDYVMLAIAFAFILVRIHRSYSLYRTQYVLILGILILIVLLNLGYMALGLVLDASVVFYAVGGILIYICITIFVPRSLMVSAIGRAVDNMNEGLILLDLDNHYIYANTFAAKHFDITAENFTLRSEPVATVLRNLVNDDSSYGSIPYVKKTNPSDSSSDRHYRVKYSNLADHKGRIIGSYFLIEDTTEEVFFLNEIREAKTMAEKANEAKSTFLANMSHEIRTPLNSILGMNQMILRSANDPILKDYAEGIQSAGDILLGLINDVLDFSKIEANKMEVITRTYNPHDLLRDCYLCFEQMAGKKGLYLEVKSDDSLPSALKGDFRLINQVLSNITSNALKYTKTGGVTIDMEYEKTGDESIDLIISVSDTGIGIVKEDIPFLFDSFKRVNEKQNASIQGTGLGLAITKDLITIMNGSIFVDSKVGVGSKFTVRLPQKVADFTPVGPFSKQAEVAEETYKESFKAPDARILVVDDVPMNLMVVEGLLKPTELKIDKASGGDEAIELCKKTKYDVILLDHRMPEKDGVETFNIISKEGLNTNTPVIMLTANALSGVEEEYRGLGFADYLSKPTRVEDLEAALIRHLPSEKVTLVEK
jgi:signal transduction histidine kinase/CheY-like chemotaxis protein